MKSLSRLLRRNCNVSRSLNRHLRCEPLEQRTLLAVVITEPTGGVEVSESGVTAAYEVVLDAEPAANVVITLTPDGQLDVSPESLTFTPDNWDQVQEVTVSAIDDTDVEGDHNGIIAHTATSEDASYDGIEIDDVTVAITDNDSATNAPPTIDLVNTTTTLSEDTDMSVRRKVADLAIVDDGEGNNSLSLSGADADLFELDGSVALYLKAGAPLDFETNPQLDVTVSIDDPAIGQTPDDSASLTITLTDANDAPQVTVPVTGPNVNEAANATATVSGISVEDPDAGTSQIVVTLAIPTNSGTLAVQTVSGGAAVSGNGSRIVTLTGTVSQINATLDANVAYTVPNADFNGNVSLTVTANDQGNTGAGGAKSQTKQVAITVAAVNDSPSIAAPTSLSVGTGADLFVTPISVADVDANTADVEVTLEVAQGTLTVKTGVTGGLTADDIQGNHTKTVTLTGTIAQINATLADSQGLKYVSDTNYTGSETLTIAVDDKGNTGSGGAKSVQKPVTITVVAANQPPVVTVPTAQTVAEDTDLAIAGISIHDPDAASAEIRVTLAVAHGTLTVKDNVSGGLTAAKIQGNGTGSVVLTGSLAQINNTLAASQGLVYRGQADYVGADSLAVTANDQGNTGPGGAKSDAEQIAITVTAVNDAPVITIPGEQAVPSGAELVLSGISITDADAGSATVEVKFEVDHGTLTFKTDVTGGLVAADVVGNGTGTVTVTSSLAKIKNTLDASAGLKYRGTTGYTGPETLTITANDQGNSGSGVAKTTIKDLPITVAGANQAPVVTVPGTQSATEDTDKYITGISIADADAGSSDIRVTLTVTHGTLTVKNDVSGGLTGSNISGNGTSSVTLTGSRAKINATLANAQGVKYKGLTNNTTTATLSVMANDLGNTGTGGAQSGSGTVSITLSAVNDAPQVTVPSALAVAPNTDLAVSGVSIADVDAGTANVVVTLAIGHGSLTLRTDVSGGLATADIQGNGTGTVTLTGTVAKINATLAASGGLKYRGTTESTTPNTLAVTVNDQGNTGSGGAKTATKNLSITVTTANQAPVVTVPGAKTIAQNTDLAISGISIADPDAATGAIEVTLEVSHGTLTVLTNVSGGVAAGGVSGNGTAKIVLTGTLSQVNATLAATNGLKYKSAATYTGADSLKVKADDKGNTGTGGAKTDQETVAITVTGVNAAPVLTVPASVVAPKNGEREITGISVSDADAGTGEIEVTLEVSHGTLTVLTNVSGGVAAGGVSGNGTAKVVLKGTVAKINATLAATNGLKYKPNANYAGSDSLKVTANDKGNTGSGGAKTDQETISVLVGSGSLSGIVYMEGDGQDGYAGPGNGTQGDMGLAGVTVKLRQKTGTGDTATWSDVATVKTGPDGFYLFKDIPAGTYEVVETQPAKFRDGKAEAGSGGGTANGNSITNIVLESGSHITDNNFAEAGINPQYVGIRLFLNSTPGCEEVFSSFTGIKKVKITGTSSNDDIQFTAGANSHTVVVNGKTTTYSADEVDVFMLDALGGNDKVTLNGKAGADEARIRPGYGVLRGAGYMVEVFGAEEMKADGKGGDDNAIVYDSTGDDDLTATGNKATVSGVNYLAELIAFERMQAISEAGGDDTVERQTIDYVLELIGDWNQ